MRKVGKKPYRITFDQLIHEYCTSNISLQELNDYIGGTLEFNHYKLIPGEFSTSKAEWLMSFIKLRRYKITPEEWKEYLKNNP